MTLPCASIRRPWCLPAALLALVLAPGPALSRPLLADPIAPDAQVNGGAWRVDDYGGSTRSKVARWVTELPEGHHVVVGLDNLPGGAVSGSYRNLVLARFDAQGEPMPWLAPPALLPVDANHVVVDLGTAAPGLDVRGVAVGPNRLYVLIDRVFEGTRRPYLFAFALHGPLVYEQPLSTDHHGSGLAYLRTSGATACTCSPRTARTTCAGFRTCAISRCRRWATRNPSTSGGFALLPARSDSPAGSTA